MMAVLQKFNFGEDFVKWINVYMCRTQSCVTNAGWLSEYFYLERGIRQGCPLSALLFVLSLEILACKIRQSPNVKGIKLPGCEEELCIAQYADDNTLFCSNEESITGALMLVDEFLQISGLYLNWNKTEGIYIGNWKFRRKTIGNFKWNIGPGSKLKILGIVFANNESAGNLHENWVNQMDKIQKLVDVWRKRDLSLMGRVTVVKSLILSKVTHLLQVLLMPEEYRSKINNLVFKYIWNLPLGCRGGERVKRNVLIQNYTEGGMKMVTVDIMQKSGVLDAMNKILKMQLRCTAIPRWLFGAFCPDLNLYRSL
jgi:hypothetical protein